MNKVGIFTNYRLKDSEVMAEKLMDSLTDRNLTFIKSQDIKTNHPDFIICFGGDGTLLSASRFSYGLDIPILSINTGNLGFLTEVDMENAKRAVELVIDGKYTIDERMMLSAKVLRDNKTVNEFISLNDIVIHRGMLSRAMDFSITVNGTLLGTHKGDGIIYSSPTGSTAYSLSAGGPIVYPKLDIALITFICPHSLMARPTIIPSEMETQVKILSDNGLVSLTVDGQVNSELKINDVITLTRAEKKTKFIRITDLDFFGIVREKLSPNYIKKN